MGANARGLKPAPALTSPPALAQLTPMQTGLPFPDISPEIFSISIAGFEFALRWYAMAYIVGILIGWYLAVRLVRAPQLWARERAPTGPKGVEDYVTWLILGVILGGRLGYVLFYQPGYYLQNPLEIPAIWTGGMSFHGGFLGVVVASVIWCRRNGVEMLAMADLLAVVTPPALLLGRLANFINAELWGRPTSLPWGVIFPGGDAQDCGQLAGLCARHPSQLYEAAMEGLILGAVLLFLAYRRGLLRRRGAALGIFVGGYGLARFLVEFVRQPDAQFVSADNPVGHALNLGAGLGLTMGQLLSVPMIAVGLFFALRARRI